MKALVYAGNNSKDIVERPKPALMAPGDVVVQVTRATIDGKCAYSGRRMYSHFVNGGLILGNRIDGTQAELVRNPLADDSLYRLPEGFDDEAPVMLGDIVPTGCECGVLNGRVQPVASRSWPGPRRAAREA